MADNTDEKTEKPTGKRLKDARKEGNVPQSREVTSAVALAVSFYGMSFFYRSVRRGLTAGIGEYFKLAVSQDTLGVSQISGIFKDVLLRYTSAVLPFFLAVILSVIAAVLLQTRFLVNFRYTFPKLSRLDPFEGIKKLFSTDGLYEILKSLFKIIMIIYIIFISIKSKISGIHMLMDGDIFAAAEFTEQLIFDIINKTVVLLAVFAAADYLYQKFRYMKKLRMSRQEVKEELKFTEGDLQAKGRIRSRQRQLSQNSILHDAQHSDVIISDGNSLVIALKYEHERSDAPFVSVKVKGTEAAAVVMAGEKNGVAVVEDVTLAHSLYSAVESGEEIPPEFYDPVADILAGTFSFEKKELN